MAFWRKKSTGNGWTAIVFGIDRIAVADVLRRRDARPRVLACETFARDGSDLDALKRLRAAKRLGKHHCTTLLWHGQYKLIQVDLPENLTENTPHTEMCELLRWRVKDMVDFPVEQAGIEALPIPGQSSRSGQAWVVAASHTVLQPRIHLFQDARVNLEAIDIPELAQRNIAALLEEKDRGLAFAAFNEKDGRLTVTYRGELYMSRHLDVGAPELTGQNAESFHERALLDIQRSLDSFDRSFSSIPLTRLMVAPMANGAGFIEYLNGNLSLPVSEANLADALDFHGSHALAEVAAQPDALLALGAALRE